MKLSPNKYGFCKFCGVHVVSINLHSLVGYNTTWRSTMPLYHGDSSILDAPPRVGNVSDEEYERYVQAMNPEWVTEVVKYDLRHWMG